MKSNHNWRSFTAQMERVGSNICKEQNEIKSQLMSGIASLELVGSNICKEQNEIKSQPAWKRQPPYAGWFKYL